MVKLASAGASIALVVSQVLIVVSKQATAAAATAATIVEAKEVDQRWPGFLRRGMAARHPDAR